MSVSRMFTIGFSAVATVCLTTGSAAAADEWASFTIRVQESQGVGQGRAAREGKEHPYAAETAGSGEAASFVDRVRASQGIKATAAEARETYAAPAVTSEATSFIARVEESQGIRELARAEELSPEGVRLVQRALTAKGHATGITGKLDESTRSSLMGFQRESALPASGTLDEKTVEALGLDVSQVRPVRGAEER